MSFLVIKNTPSTENPFNTQKTIWILVSSTTEFTYYKDNKMFGWFN